VGWGAGQRVEVKHRTGPKMSSRYFGSSTGGTWVGIAKNALGAEPVHRRL